MSTTLEPHVVPQNANDELRFVEEIYNALKTLKEYHELEEKLNVDCKKEYVKPDVPYPDKAWDTYYYYRLGLAKHWICDYHNLDDDYIKDENDRGAIIKKMVEVLIG